MEEEASIYLNTIGKLICRTIHNFKSFHVLEPVTLIGEGEYNLNVLKEIKATDSYLGLDEDTRDCQNKEPFFNCTTREYLDTILGKCGCLPMKIGETNKVHIFSIFPIVQCTLFMTLHVCRIYFALIQNS